MGWKFAKALTEKCQHKKSTKESSLIFILPNRDLKSGGKLRSGNIEDLSPYLRCFRSSTLLCCYIFSSTNIYCNVLWMIIWLGNQQLSAWLYNHEKNRNKTTNHSPQHVHIIPLSILPRLTKISIFMVVIISSDFNHHICLLSYLS